MNNLKAYTYTDADAGITGWPYPARFSLPLCEPTDKPAEADVFVVPWEVWQLERTGNLDTIWNRLPYLIGNERRHVVFSCGETTWVQPQVPAIWIRCDATYFVGAWNPTCYPWPWPVDDFTDLATVPMAQRDVDIGFQGWTSTDLCTKAMRACELTPGLASVMRGDRRFFGYVQRDTRTEADQLQASYRELLRRSKLWLCPRSREDGVPRYRLFEAMSAGRIPVLLGDRTVLPFAGRIDYEACVLQIPERDVWHVGELCRDFISACGPDELYERGQVGMRAWSEWLDRRKWPQILDTVVREALGK